MAHMEPLDESELAEFEEVFSAIGETMGFVPNSLKTMARRPDLVRAFGLLALETGQRRPAPLDFSARRLPAGRTDFYWCRMSSASARWCQPASRREGGRTAVLGTDHPGRFPRERRTVQAAVSQRRSAGP